MRRKIAIFCIVFAFGIIPILSHAQGVEPDLDMETEEEEQDQNSIEDDLDTTLETDENHEDEDEELEEDEQESNSDADNLERKDTDTKGANDLEGEKQEDNKSEDKEEDKLEMKTEEPESESEEGIEEDLLDESDESTDESEENAPENEGQSVPIDENGCVSIPLTLYAISPSEDDISSIRVPDAKIYLYAIPVEATSGDLTTVSLDEYPDTSLLTGYEDTRYLVGVSDFASAGYKEQNEDALFGDSGLVLQNILLQINQDSYADGWYRYQLAIGNVVFYEDDKGGLSSFTVSDDLYINLDGGAQWTEGIGLPSGYIYIDIIKDSEVGLKVYISSDQFNIPVYYSYEKMRLLRTTLVPTGISVVVIPFIILAAVGCLLLLFFLRRRRVEDEE